MAEEVVVSVESGVAVNAENANVAEGAEEFLEPEESQAHSHQFWNKETIKGYTEFLVDGSYPSAEMSTDQGRNFRIFELSHVNSVHYDSVISKDGRLCIDFPPIDRKIHLTSV